MLSLFSYLRVLFVVQRLFSNIQYHLYIHTYYVFFVFIHTMSFLFFFSYIRCLFFVFIHSMSALLIYVFIHTMLPLFSYIHIFCCCCCCCCCCCLFIHSMSSLFSYIRCLFFVFIHTMYFLCFHTYDVFSLFLYIRCHLYFHTYDVFSLFSYMRCLWFHTCDVFSLLSYICNQQPSQATANLVSGNTKGGLLRYILNTYSIRSFEFEICILQALNMPLIRCTNVFFQGRLSRHITSPSEKTRPESWPGNYMGKATSFWQLSSSHRSHQM